MGVCFQVGQQLGRGDLDIFLQNSQGASSNPAEITFSLYYVDAGPPETEVLIPPANRVPANPQVGEFYAPIQIPAAATLGEYRIRWRFRETTVSPVTEVVQPFGVVADTTVTRPVPFSDIEYAMIQRLRILLRDNCFPGDTLVEVGIRSPSGEIVPHVVSFEDLWRAIHED